MISKYANFSNLKYLFIKEGQKKIRADVTISILSQCKDLHKLTIDVDFLQDYPFGKYDPAGMKKWEVTHAK